jgi:2-polyprenyl-3-methyl-5-hydroxy-6-metoxy-1,4-benzoquinol methylase
MTTAVNQGEGLGKRPLGQRSIFQRVETAMTRAEIEKAVEPIIRKCQRELGDSTKNKVSDEDFAKYTEGMFRPDVRRVSLIISMAQDLLGPSAEGEGLEVGSGYGYLLFPMAVLLPKVRWTAVDHPSRSYEEREEFAKAFREYDCAFLAMDILREPLPYANGRFSVVTFSEVLEHLPVERLSFVLAELARVVRPGGILIMSSPNQASLENRLRLLKGMSILAMPDKLYGDTFGHIRLYTPDEMEAAMAKLGFSLESSRAESNNSAYRGAHKSWRRRIYRLYELVEGILPLPRGLSDTWYMAFRKKAA